MKSLLFLLFLIVFEGGSSRRDSITIKCDGTPHLKKYKDVFSIKILINSRVEAGFDDKGIWDREKRNSSIKTDKVYDVSGELSKSKVHITGTTILDCNTLPTIQCQLDGLYLSNNDFKQLNFTAAIHMERTDGEVTVNPERKSHFMGSEVELTCSTRVLLNGSKLRLYVENMSQNTARELVHKETSKNSNGGGTCVGVLTSKVKYTSNRSGDFLFDCFYGLEKMASRKVNFVDPEETLSLQLFLSSIILAYIPNVIIPAFAIMHWCPGGYINLRRADNISMKWWRTFLSAVVAVIFVVWTSILASLYWSTNEWFRYSKFFAVESIFLFLYPVLRASFILTDEEAAASIHPSQAYTSVSDNTQKEPDTADRPSSAKEENRRPYNARVIVSHGIVMTPLICWVMLKESPFWTFSVSEVTFLLIALPSVLSFVYVSYDREWEHWDKKDQ